MIASLQATLPRGLAHEIILVDDGSTDGTRAWLATLKAPFRVVLNESNLGYAKSNNRGAAIATGQFLALLNNDLVLLPQWLEPMLAAHRRLGAQAGPIGNVQRNARTREIDHAGIVINLEGKPEHARKPPHALRRLISPVMRVPAVTGACLVIERALWQELGGFDDRYVNGGEDVDLCYRARQISRDTAVALDSVVLHHVSASQGRKTRDEENSYRLARSWSRAFIADGTRAWCRDYLARALQAPPPSEYRLAFRALAHAAGWGARPPIEAVFGLHAAQRREFEHWETLFGR